MANNITPVQKAVEYLEQNFQKETTHKDLALIVGLSPSHLGRAFKYETGCSLKDYLYRFRIKNAQHLLQHSSIPIAAIALKVGFNSQETFHRVFLRLTKKTPMEYRMDFYGRKTADSAENGGLEILLSELRELKEDVLPLIKMNHEAYVVLRLQKAIERLESNIDGRFQNCPLLKIA